MHTTISKILILFCTMAFAVDAMAQDTLSVKPEEDSVAVDWLADSLSLQDRLDSIVANAKILATSQMGLLVYDLTVDSVLYSHDAQQTLRPASTMKIITAITALDRLGTEYLYKTQLGYSGEIIDSTKTLRGDLYIIGGMDPMISRSDLDSLALKIKALGIDSIRGNLYADRSFKDDNLYGEGWCWDDDNSMLSPLVFKRKDNMMEIFRDIINEDSIAFIGEIHDGVRPKDMKLIATITHPLSAVLRPMMKKSNNLYAESMLYQIGATQGLPSTAKKAQRVEEALLNKVGKKDALHRFSDGSGLSLYNYLSADIEVAFLRYAYYHDKIYKALYDSLPIAGIDGTLSDRMKGTSAANNVHAKTGTLSGISSLAGYCTAKNGHRLAFAIINQNVLKAIYAKRLQDKICIALTK